MPLHRHQLDQSREETSVTKISQWANDFVLSMLRTVVPIAWGWVLSQLVTHLPWLASVLGVSPGAPPPAWLVPTLMVGWYALWRKVEPKLPPWLTRLVLGANTTPAYAMEASLSGTSTPPLV